MRNLLVRFCLCVVAFVTFHQALLAGTSNSLMDISADGKLLACTNRDSGTVTVVDLASHRVLHEIVVGNKPEGVTFVGESHQFAVAAYGDDRIVFGDADQGPEQSLEYCNVFDEPYGLVSNLAGDRLFATLDFPGRVIEVDPGKRTILHQWDVGEFVRGIALDEKNQRLLITEYYTAAVKAVNTSTGEVVDQWTGASTDNLARQITLNPRRSKAYLPHIRSRITAIHGSGSIFPYVSVIDTPAGEGKRRTRIPVDSAFSTQVTANPWEVGVSSDGRQLYMVFAGTDDMFACDVLDDDYREVALRRHMRLGSNPRAVRVAPNNETVYVYQALDFDVVAFDTKSLRETARIEVTTNPLEPQVLKGKRLFYSALPPMASRRWVSCSSCHPDGDSDGRTWHNPEGLRNTQSLGGMAWTHPIHWSADRDEVQDFEHTIRGPLMQGRGLLRGDVQKSLAKPNRGLSPDLDALAAYSNSHKIPLSPFARSGLSAEAERGKKLFHSSRTKCMTCHDGPFLTDSMPHGDKQLVRHNVGTGNDDPSEKMGPKFDTPTLLGVYRTAPYLHHGQAATLTEVLTKFNPNDAHGVTSGLDETEIADLAAFLRALPYEDPVPLAKAQGRKPVVD